MPDAAPPDETRAVAAADLPAGVDGSPDGGTDAGQPVEVDVGTRLLPSEAQGLRRAVRELSAQHPMVTLRVDRVVAFDTAGLGLLLGLHRLARANGSGLVVAGPGPRLGAALRRRGLHRVLVVDPDGPGPAG